MSWLLVIAGFSVLIVLHEFGHFIVAKWTGMRVERFFLFFPPKLFSFKRGETEYGIGSIPLGGFVKITGMNPEELEPEDPSRPRKEPGLLERVESADQQDEDPDLSRPGEPLSPELRERAYYNQPVWKRVVVIAAGPVMNLLLAFVLLFALAFDAQEPKAVAATEIDSESPAQGVLADGDKLIAIDGVQLDQEPLGDRARTFATQLNTHTCKGAPTEGCVATTPATIVLERDGARQTVQVTPTYDADAPAIEEGGDPGRFRLGFAFQPTDFVPENLSASGAAERALSEMWEVTTTTASIFARIIEPEQREQISGVVGVSYVGNEAIHFGAYESLKLLALVSLSLALINLLPLLPLDGGHIFWSLVEKVRGRRVPFRVIERATAFGFILILMLAFIGLTNDIEHILDGTYNLDR
jgi:regulator of sigma E protease